jgi:putative serine protease PepD
VAAAAVGAIVGAGVGGGIVAVSNRDTTPAATVVTQAGVTSAAGSTGVPAATGTNLIAPLVEQAAPSIVSIHDSVTQTNQFGQTLQGQAAGSGFVLSADGTIVTNDHVIDGATDITVNFHDGTSASATVIAADPLSDLAVLKVDRTGLTPLPVGNSDTLQVGDQLVAIGNALDLSGQPTVTTGIVSAVNRSIDEPNGVHLVDLIQTDTAINPGNSGGPLLNMAGQVIGINTAIAGQAQNIGFAIAITPAQSLITDLSSGTVPGHALLGVATQPTSTGRAGADIAQVSPGSAAEAAGIRAGDVVTKVDDTPITTPDDLSTAIAEHRPGDTIAITLERNGAQQTLSVVLGARN